MIVSLTLNPAVDKTIAVPRMVPGTVTRVHHSRLDPGGKGINVSRIVNRLGVPTIALGFLAGNTGILVERALDGERVLHSFRWLSGETRLNVTLLDESMGQRTSFWDEGPEVDPGSLRALRTTLTGWLRSCRVLVAAGSLPPGVPGDVYADILREASGLDVKTILETGGDALRLGVTGHPDVLVIDKAEAEALLEHGLPNAAAVAAGASDLLRIAPAAVVVEMGVQGSVCVTSDRVLQALPPPSRRARMAGSGDALAAGLAIALDRGEALEDGLRLGAALGALTSTIALDQTTELTGLAELRAAVGVRELLRGTRGEVDAPTAPAAMNGEDPASARRRAASR